MAVINQNKSQESKHEELLTGMSALLISEVSTALWLLALLYGDVSVYDGGAMSANGRQNSFVVFKRVSSLSTSLRSDVMICLLVRISI